MEVGGIIKLADGVTYKILSKEFTGNKWIMRVEKAIGCVATAPSWLDRLLGGISVRAACGDIIKTTLGKGGNILGFKLNPNDVVKSITMTNGHVKTSKGLFRVDVEKFANRPASLHIQDPDNLVKYYFNPQNGKLYELINKEFVESANSVQKILENVDIQKGVNKALARILEEKYF